MYYDHDIGIKQARLGLEKTTNTFTYCRYGYTNTKEITLKRKLLKGTIQGGVLSPLLCNMCADTLLKLYDGTNIFCSILC